jgi:phosphoribosylamine--glycine ligase
MTRVCVVGAGAREHALAVALARTASVVVAPGNPGITALSPGIGCTSQMVEEIDADLFVIGPEVPLVGGLADRLRGRGKLVLGPGADGAQVEGSKAWMKELLVTAGVPTAAHGSFEDEAPAVAFLRQLTGDGPYVVKTDGLAAGKGVLVTASIDEAIDDVRAKLSGSAFGAAGTRVVIEEGLIGDELSVMALCDGTRAVPLAAARDYKRAGEGDTGPNTGGMGAFSPVPWAGSGDDLVDTVMDTAVLPTLAALRRQGIDYRGVLYAGIMLTADGPKVLEFNVRFGDPEAQAVLPRWQGDVVSLLAAAASGSLGPAPSFSDQAAVCVVLAADGYPSQPRTGDVIGGWAAAATMDGVQLYAGAVGQDDRGLATSGGRVLSVSALGDGLPDARDRAYAAAAMIDWPGRQLRRDIAGRATAGVRR